MADDGRFHGLIRRVGISAWSIIGVALVIALIGFLIIEGRVILGPLLLAVVLVYILNPLVTWLNAKGLHRIVGAAIGFLIILAVVFILGFFLIPSIADQARGFTDEFPDIYENSASQVESLAERFGFAEVNVWSYDEVVDYLSDPDNRDTITDLVLDRLGSITSGLFEFILVFLLGPALAFYVLIDLPGVQRRGLDLLPEENQAEAAFVGNELNTAVGGFLRGQLLVAIIVGVLLSFGYWIIDLRFWLLIGMVGGLLNIVPFLGPWVGGALGVIVALTTADVTTAFWAVVVAVVVQQIDNNFVSPSVLRATVRLHPAMTLIVLVLGGAIAGVWGVIVAVPLAATVKILLGHWWRTRVLGQTWEEAGEALIEEHEPPRRFRGAESRESGVAADDAPAGDSDAEEGIGDG